VKETRASKTRQRTRIGKPMRKSLFDNLLARINARGFTLVELLVVVSIIAVLLAILLPVAGRVRGQARAVVCQSNLRAWGFAFSTHRADHEGKFFAREDSFRWPYALRPYCVDDNDLLLRPAARRHYLRDDPADTSPPSFRAARLGSRDTTWRAKMPSDTGGPSTVFGSYGFNLGMDTFYSDAFGGGRSSEQRMGAAETMPVLLDCMYAVADGWHYDRPPVFEGDVDSRRTVTDIKCFCMDRHSGGVNGLFLDWSVRKVGVKELWTLRWASGSNLAGPWTKRGGVQAEDWPQWMRRFRDY
jgi:prepilin-type N-terminal cleavage/methylation domain-containing protein/prepilin-type processing-associated H-X9-DG protein